MATPSPTPDLGPVSGNRRLTVLFGFYVVALFMIVAFLAASVYAAAFLIVVAETVFFFWRPTPTLGPASYSGPMPTGWQTPIRVMRWYEMIRGCLGMAVTGVAVTVIVGIVIFAMKPRGLGPANFVVGAVFAVWLISRPLWYPLLRKRLSRSFQGVKKDLSKDAAMVSVGADGVDVVQKINAIGGPSRGPWVFHVTFAEIDELRMLNAIDAQMYWQTMEQYDPTLAVRAAIELSQFIQGQLPRPSIFQNLAGGAHLLIRSPSVLYLIAWADESGPAAIAAWQAWRSAHEIKTTPTA